MKYTNSPIQRINYKNKILYIKRDDLLDKDFSGNKARKFFYFMQKDFTGVKKLISYGSSQANSLYSMSVLAQKKGWEFDFYVNHISKYLKENPQGNYKYSIQNGARIIENPSEDLKEYIEKNCLDESVLFIDEGGRVKEALYGVAILANEIKEWIKENNIKNPVVYLPSGTGSTALFLQKNLDFDVYTIACVGGSEYLKKQFFDLENDERFHPKIIKTEKKYHFGKLYMDFYNEWKDLKEEVNIEFDLLYDPLAFLYLDKIKELNNKDIIYIHQGGIIGNETMIPRYLRKENNYKNMV